MSRDVDNRDQLAMNAYLQERVDFLKGHIDFLNKYIRSLENLVDSNAKTIQLLAERDERRKAKG